MNVQRQYFDSSSLSSDPVAAPTVMSDDDTYSKRFKLVRWPPALLLRNDPLLVRMATLLSRRAMSAIELATATQIPLGRARDFVNVLKASMLLEEQTAVPQLQNRPRSQTNPPLQKVAPGLINRIRLRLGL